MTTDGAPAGVADDANPLGVEAPAPRPDNQDPARFGQTPSQTVGPFFHYGLPWKGGADLVGRSDMGARPELFAEEHYVLHLTPPREGEVAGEVIALFGRVTDGAGEPVPDAMVEIWQADAGGRYPGDGRDAPPRDPHFQGFGRASTDQDGTYRFRTVRPGRVPGPGTTLQAAHIAVGVFGRGLLKRLVTRIYFEDGEGLGEDAVLAAAPPERRDTLVARRKGEGWRFDIVLQGVGETVFFDL